MVYYTTIRLRVCEGEASFILPSSKERVRIAVFWELPPNNQLQPVTYIENSQRQHLLFIFLLVTSCAPLILKLTKIWRPVVIWTLGGLYTSRRKVLVVIN